MKRWETALITGGSSGIGRALAEGLVRRGTRVVICARKKEPLEEAAKAVGAVPIQADMAVPEQAADIVAKAIAELGSLDLVIANAGFGGDRPASRLEPRHVTAMMQTNVIGACVTLTAAIPHMLERGRGNLAGMSSLAAVRGLPTSAVYSASKAAVSTFLESIRVDLFRTGVVVTDVRPGFVDTPLTKKNKFEMPFLMPADRAAEGILDAIAAGKRVYAFPWPMAFGAKALTWMPAWMYDRIGSRVNVKKD
jgi:short-subunit dehydrogenase